MTVVVVIQDGEAYMLQRDALADMLKKIIAGEEPRASQFAGIGIGEGVADLTAMTPLAAERVLARLFADEAAGLHDMVVAA